MNSKVSIVKISIIALLLCLVVAIIGLCITNHIADGIESSSDDLLNKRGLFGDSWGGVNAIVSAFAFAGVIVTLILQNRDLNLQRHEMELQRQEFEEQNETIRYQRFENLFYNMLNLQQKIVDGLRFSYKERLSQIKYSRENLGTSYASKEVVGRDVFRYLFERVSFLASCGSRNYNIVNGYREFLNRAGLSCYDSAWIPTYFDHYFSHLYKIIQFVDNQHFKNDEAYRYLSLLRSTLSRYELVWLYYNALNPEFSGFKKLIEKYSLLKNMRAEMLTRTKEAEEYLNSIEVTEDDLNKHGFGTGDFGYYLTDSPEDESKYHLSAFWSKKSLQDGEAYLQRWKKFVNGKK